MGILNLEEGTFTGLESLENEFKSMLKEVLQETVKEELTSHLGYEKNQISNNTNSRNDYNKKKINSNKRKTKSKGSFPTIDSSFKVLYLSIQEVQNKWKNSKVRNWNEIYPQLRIFFSEIMEKYTK